ncbi:LGFP repeat family protein [Mycobacterium intracellulare]|nr:LGFP repeat family protein [Mycobacterium intracellulare]
MKGLQVAIDPTAAINMAGGRPGPNGPLGAKQGGQTPIGGDGIVQNFAGGKVFFTPATGANALETDILAKYESLGGARRQRPRIPGHQRNRRRHRPVQPDLHLLGRRQTGDLPDRRARRVRRARGDEGRLGQTARSGRQTGGARRRPGRGR